MKIIVANGAKGDIFLYYKSNNVINDYVNRKTHIPKFKWLNPSSGLMRVKHGLSSQSFRRW